VEGDHPRQIAFAGGGRVLVVARSNRLEHADPDGLRLTSRFTDPTLRRWAHEEGIGAVAVHPSGAFVATSSHHDADRRVKVWVVGSARLAGSVPVPGTGPIGLAWSGDGRFLLATAPGQVLRFEFGGFGVARFAAFHPFPLEAAAFSPDGKHVAAIAEAAPGKTGTLLSAGESATASVPMLPWTEPSRAGLDVAPGGKVIATRTGTGFQIWDVAGGPVRACRFTEFVARCPRLSPDGKVLWALVGGTSVRAWDYPAGTDRGGWTNSAGEFVSGLAGLEALAPGRTRAAAGGRDGTVYVFDERVRPTARIPLPGDPVQAVALTPDETVVVAGTRAGRLRVIRVADGVELPGTEAHPGGVAAVAMNAERLLVTGGKDRTVKIWRRVGYGFEPILTVAGLSSPVQGVEFDPTGTRLLVVLAGEHAVRVWDLNALRTRAADLGLGW
jgi:WD40 repeat protein